MKKKRKTKKKKKQLKLLTPWHIVFNYVLEELLPNDVFDIITEVEVGKLPLKIDFIIIKKIKDIRVELPVFFDFLNDYEYAVLEYKSPKDKFGFFDYLRLISYTNLYCEKEKLVDIGKVIRVGVYSDNIKELFELLEKNGYGTEEKLKGYYYIKGKPNEGYLINLDEVEKRDREIILNFFGKHKKGYEAILDNLSKRESEISFAKYILSIIIKGESMKSIKMDKEFMKRANMTIEAFVKALPIEMRLKGLKPEDRLKGLKPEDRLKGLTKEQIEEYLKKLDN